MRKMSSSDAILTEKMTPSQLSVFLFLLLCQMHQTFAQMPSVQYTISTLVGYDPKPDQSISLAHIGQPSGLIIHNNYLYFQSLFLRVGLEESIYQIIIATSAQLTSINSLYLANNPMDGTPELFIACQSHVVRKINLVTMIIEKVAGISESQGSSSVWIQIQQN